MAMLVARTHGGDAVRRGVNELSMIIPLNSACHKISSYTYPLFLLLYVLLSLIFITNTDQDNLEVLYIIQFHI
jgi:hypothetical protein